MPHPPAMLQLAALRRIALVALVAGFALTAALLAHFGLPEVAAALHAAGFAGLAAVSLLHLLALALMGVAWWAVAGGRRAPAPARIFVWARLIRDAGSEVLPLSQVGGYVLGARALILRGVAAPLAAATTIADVTFDLCAQVAYTVLGLVLLLRLRPNTPLALPLTIGIAVAVAAAAGFILAQHRGAARLDRLAACLARDWLRAISAAAVAVQAEIRAIYADRGGNLLCLLLHLAAWIGTGVEAWVALRLMGVTLGFAPVLVIESLLYAIRSAAFVVPNAIGIQEGAYIMLGANFGLGPDVALALSLLKRGRDLLLGIAPLLVWQLIETRRFWSARPLAAAILREAVEGENPRPVD